MSFNKYRAIDIALWTVILAVFEAVCAVAAKNWFPLQLYTLSPTVAVLSILIMRWGPFAAVHCVIGGAVYCIAVGASPEQYVIYCLGNCFALFVLFLFKALGKPGMPGKEKIRGSAWLTAVYTVCTYCLVQLGRWIVSMFFGAAFSSIIDFFATDPISLLFAVVVVLIARNADGLFEDQKSYLIRTEAERRRENNDF